MKMDEENSFIKLRTNVSGVLLNINLAQELTQKDLESCISSGELRVCPYIPVMLEEYSGISCAGVLAASKTDISMDSVFDICTWDISESQNGF